MDVAATFSREALIKDFRLKSKKLRRAAKVCWERGSRDETRGRVEGDAFDTGASRRMVWERRRNAPRCAFANVHKRLKQLARRNRGAG